MPYDIAESNQRQSDFLWGYGDAEDGIAPRCDRAAYMRGYTAAPRGKVWAKTRAHILRALAGDRVAIVENYNIVKQLERREREQS